MRHIEPSKLFGVVEGCIELTRDEQTHLAFCDDCLEVLAVFESYITKEAVKREQ